MSKHENEATCENCSHYEVCKIIETFKNTLRRHKKIFIPREDPAGPTKKLLSLFAKECMYFCNTTR